MIQPQFLQLGDKVAIVAPGRKLDQASVDAAAIIMQNWGLNVLFGKNLFNSHHSYLSGTDEERLYDLQAALNDSSIKAIICARGGYGTTRILDQLDFTAFTKKPKWICGFSDITALHLKLQTLGMQSIHSTMPVLFTKEESTVSVESLRSILFGKAAALTAPPSAHNIHGDASGKVVGGNLSLIVDALGTASEISTENKILILEEVDEYVYRLDRMLVHLKRAGKLKNLSALIIGHMTDIKEGELPFGETVQQLIRYHIREYNYPVAFNFPTGHENPNMAWVQGASATLEVTIENSVLRF